MLFRLQKYKKFESNSQHLTDEQIKQAVVSTAKVQKIWEQFTTCCISYDDANKLFRLQKYKKFESNSQRHDLSHRHLTSCFDCKSTKNLRAIHNFAQKQAKQIQLFRLQKYKKFESNSQQFSRSGSGDCCCFDCKSTKNLRAIHNTACRFLATTWVVSTAKVQKIWEQFTTRSGVIKRESRCFDCKSTKNLRAIHNSSRISIREHNVVSTAKVQKIWEQFTTRME